MEIEEKILKIFLEDLDAMVFVKSTNSVTGKEVELTPKIEDQEAIIVINGEWDREDLKEMLGKIAKDAVDDDRLSLVEWAETHKLSADQFRETDEGDMCPNCNTPWKCNGPHLQKEDMETINQVYDDLICRLKK